MVCYRRCIVHRRVTCWLRKVTTEVNLGAQFSPESADERGHGYTTDATPWMTPNRRRQSHEFKLYLVVQVDNYFCSITANR